MRVQQLTLWRFWEVLFCIFCWIVYYFEFWFIGTWFRSDGPNFVEIVCTLIRIGEMSQFAVFVIYLVVLHKHKRCINKGIQVRMDLLEHSSKLLCYILSSAPHMKLFKRSLKLSFSTILNGFKIWATKRLAFCLITIRSKSAIYFLKI